ncbi:MAG: hypothetical protein ACK5WI_04655, partial [Cyanobacteriota bacterium]
MSFPVSSPSSSLELQGLQPASREAGSVSSSPVPQTQRRGSYWITTFGCQMNKADSERMAGILEARGYSPATNEHSADLVLYNTCS